LAGFTFQNDSTWHGALTWIVHALVQAEESGITSQNIDSFLDSDDVAITRFLGTEGSLGAEFGLPTGFAARVIRHVGNYGEVYERHFGEGSPFPIPRCVTLNALHFVVCAMIAPH